MGERLNYFPKSEYISQNPVFLLEYSGIKPTMKSCSNIYLIDQKGNRTNLMVVEGYGKQNVPKNRFHYDWQDRYVLLKPEKKLKRNAEVSIFIDTPCLLKIRGHSVLKKTWRVKNKVDKIAPKFESKVIGEYHGAFNGSAPSHGIGFNVKATDNNIHLNDHPTNYTVEQKLKYALKKHLLIELSDLNGIKYIFPLINGRFSFSNGICYSNFSLPNSIKEKSKDYVYEARLIDFSGNQSLESMLIKFKIIKKPPQIHIATFEGVEHTIVDNNCNAEKGPKELTIEGATWKNVSGNGCTFFDVYFEKNAIEDFNKKVQKEVTNKKTEILGELKQNTPNPTSETTTIEYYLAPKIQSATIKVFNVSGMELQSIPLHKKGVHSIEIDCKALSSGVYFYTLMIAGEAVETKKMVVE